MSKPDDIPQDVWDAALRKAELLNDDYAIGGASVDPVAETIARAILAEREANARKADRYTTAKYVRRCRELTTHEVYEVKIFARLIAHDIRKGGA